MFGGFSGQPPGKYDI